MRPYSLDLRQRVLAALDAGKGSQPEIAGTVIRSFRSLLLPDETGASFARGCSRTKNP